MRLPSSPSFDAPSAPSRWVPLLLGALALAACSSGSSSGAGATPAVNKVVHLFNPFTGVSPSWPNYHGDEIGWGKEAMVQEGSCGWYTYRFKSAAPGLFRFVNDAWVKWGITGLNSDSNFSADAMLAQGNDVYVWADSAGNGQIDSKKPFDCSPDAGPAPTNPYAKGQLPSNARTRLVDNLYASCWLPTFYEEDPGGQLARIRFDAPDQAQTVSEGIGYGMLIFVYVNDASARARFDKLWAYYQRFAKSNGLMNWRISGFSGVLTPDAATDADLDVATALALASKKWGDASYLTASQKLFAAIRTNELNASGTLKPGDTWDTAKNPSYFSFVAFELAKRVDTDGSASWSAAIDRHYALWMAARHPTTGLIANWTNEAGQPADPGTGYPNWSLFGYDAIRIPWRAAWAAAWYGADPAHARATEVAGGMCRFIAGASGQDAQAIREQYTLDGQPQGNANPAGPGTVGAFATACMHSPADAAMLDRAYGALGTCDQTHYYQTTLELLTGLLLTGQMPNLWTP